MRGTGQHRGNGTAARRSRFCALGRARRVRCRRAAYRRTQRVFADEIVRGRRVRQGWSWDRDGAVFPPTVRSGRLRRRVRPHDLPALRSFVRGLRRDQDPVTPRSQPALAQRSRRGHVNRIKMLKSCLPTSRSRKARQNPDSTAVDSDGVLRDRWLPRVNAGTAWLPANPSGTDGTFRVRTSAAACTWRIISLRLRP